MSEALKSFKVPRMTLFHPQLILEADHKENQGIVISPCV